MAQDSRIELRLAHEMKERWKLQAIEEGVTLTEFIVRRVEAEPLRRGHDASRLSALNPITALPDDEIPPDSSELFAPGDWNVPEEPERPRVYSEQFRTFVDVDVDGRVIPPE